MRSGVTAEFVENLCQLSLLEEAQVEELRTGLQFCFADPRELAQELMRRGWLTAYQINQIFQGRGDDLVFGPYLFLERLGEGGMGQVFKARQRNLDRIVALKVIRRDYLHDPRAVPRFQREMQVISQLSHPNIVHAFDAGQIEGVYFIAMEYIDGLDFSRLVKQSGPLPVPMACDYIRQVALGLQHAHERSLVHRDIKPANMLVPHANLKGGSDSSSAIRLLTRPSGDYPWGLVKILDLGLARCLNLDTDSSIGNLTQMGVVVGTPDFIAPEQARNSHACDIRSDLYSLGCTFYYLLAGRVPFPHGTLTEKLLHHQLDEPEPIAQVREYKLVGNQPGQLRLRRDFLEVPAEVTAIVARMMAKKPADRFQIPWELAAVLAAQPGQAAKPASASPWAVVKSRPVTLPSLTLPEKLPRRTDPAPGTAIPVGILIKEPDQPAVSVPPALSLDQTVALETKRRTFPWRKYWPMAAGAAVAAALMLAILFLPRAAKDYRSAPPPPPPPGAKAASPEKLPSDALAEAEWKKLQPQLAQDPAGQIVDLRLKLLAFRQRFVAAPQTQAAGDWLVRLPSSLDKLDPQNSSKIDKPVAVLGEENPPPGMKSRALCVAFSPDCSQVAAGFDDQGVRLWEPLAGLETQLLGHKDRVTQVAFSPTGTFLASAGADGVVRVWDTRNKKFLRNLESQQSPVVALAFAPDGKTLATGGSDGQVRLWDPRTGKEQTSWWTKAGPGKLRLAFAPDGRTLFWSGADRQVHWRHLDGDQAGNEGSYAQALGLVSAMAFQPQGKTLACAYPDGTLRLLDWDGAALGERTTLKEPAAENERTPQVFALAFAPDGKTLLATSAQSVCRWDVAGGQPLLRMGIRNVSIRGSALASDGRHLALTYGSSNIFLFRLPNQLAVPEKMMNDE